MADWRSSKLGAMDEYQYGDWQHRSKEIFRIKDEKLFKKTCLFYDGYKFKSIILFQLKWLLVHRFSVIAQLPKRYFIYEYQQVNQLEYFRNIPFIFIKAPFLFNPQEQIKSVNRFRPLEDGCDCMVRWDVTNCWDVSTWVRWEYILT